MSRLPSPKAFLILIAVVGGTLAFGVWFYTRIVPDAGGAGHGAPGSAQMFAVIFSLLLGLGLIVLMFVSKRRGFDNNLARRQDDPSSDR